MDPFLEFLSGLRYGFSRHYVAHTVKVLWPDRFGTLQGIFEQVAQDPDVVRWSSIHLEAEQKVRVFEDQIRRLKNEYVTLRKSAIKEVRKAQRKIQKEVAKRARSTAEIQTLDEFESYEDEKDDIRYEVRHFSGLGMEAMEAISRNRRDLYTMRLQLRWARKLERKVAWKRYRAISKAELKAVKDYLKTQGATK